MKKLELRVRGDLLEKLKLKVGQLHGCINKENDVVINGSVTLDGKLPEGIEIILKANLCDENGNILYIIRGSGIDFALTNYDTFSIWCCDVSRFLEIDKLHHVELYPCAKRKE